MGGGDPQMGNYVNTGMGKEWNLPFKSGLSKIIMNS